MKELQSLYAGTVDASEIDDLGHMNVRYYGERALASTATLLAEHGLDREACDATRTAIDVYDMFTRHYREQMVGAPLEVMGGVLDVSEEYVRLYHELRNTETGDRAATFVHRARLRSLEATTGERLPESVRKSLGESLVEWPQHGRSRSIDLDHESAALSLAEARDRDLAIRKVRTVREDECDATGHVPAARRIELIWGGEPISSRVSGPPMFDLDDGSRMSLAAAETRSLLIESPRPGTRIQSFSAIIEVARKTVLRRTWVFDVDRERLLMTNTLVDIALHLGERRSLVIPDAIRANFEANLQPDLR